MEEQASVEEPRVARGWVWMLWAAAAYNLAVGVPGLVMPGTAVTDRIVALLVACFGLVYAMVGFAPVRLAPVLWTGVIGKAGVIALLVPEVLAGRAIPGTGAIITGDAIFALGFVAFLLRRR